MLLSLKEIRFDDGDDGRNLEIGGGRYLGYDEETDFYFISDDPQPMRAKSIENNAPSGGSADEILAFAVDRAYCVDFVAVGVLYRLPDGYVVVAGDMVGDLEEDLNVPGVCCAPLVYRYPKEKPPEISRSVFLARILLGAENTMRSFMDHFELSLPDDLDVSMFVIADWGEPEDDKMEVEADKMEVEAHNMNQQPHTNTWNMEHLSSSLEDCATPNCSHSRGMPRTDIWSMEQLRSSLGTCAMGNCPHCRGY